MGLMCLGNIMWELTLCWLDSLTFGAVIIIVITCFSCHKRQGASADELQVKAAKILPFVGLARPSKTQSTVGTVLSIHTAPHQLGP